MMYIHYCAVCRRIHMLNGHKQNCPRCAGHLAELKMDYITYASLDDQKRVAFLAECANPERLATLKTTYRMYKYSKWFKESGTKHEDGNTGQNQ